MRSNYSSGLSQISAEQGQKLSLIENQILIKSVHVQNGICSGGGGVWRSEDSLWELALTSTMWSQGSTSACQACVHAPLLGEPSWWPKSVLEVLLISVCGVNGKLQMAGKNGKGKGTHSLIHSGGSGSDELSRPKREHSRHCPVKEGPLSRASYQKPWSLSSATLWSSQRGGGWTHQRI